MMAVVLVAAAVVIVAVMEVPAVIVAAIVEIVAPFVAATIIIASAVPVRVTHEAHWQDGIITRLDSNRGAGDRNNA